MIDYEEYREAMRMGKKAYSEALSKGWYPYLPALDDLITQSDIEAELYLGTVEIPVEKIVGTKTAGRTTAFASNFMPLLGEKTEFGTKWVSLADSLKEEGLRDSIKAYEYMNRFYVLEGNKRVSVMKYYKASTIPGEVTRIVPKRNDSPENKLYFEFTAFYRLSKVNYLNFTRPGSYNKLQQLVGKGPKDEWTSEEQADFHSLHTRFTKAYQAKAGSKPPVPSDEALLVFLGIYTYPTALNFKPADFKTAINKSWEEILLSREERTIELSMNPAEEVRKGIITRLFKQDEEKKTLKVAFIHDKDAHTSGWTYGHELGRMALEQKLGDRIETTVWNDVSPTEPGAVNTAIEEAIAQGHEIIFTTTPKFLQASLQAALDHPEVKILNCSLNNAQHSVRTYYGRMYEAKFLIGAIAGALSETDHLGYIADYPIYGMTANINAFALGAMMTNPRAKVYLEWSTIKDRNIHESLKTSGACFISDRDMIIPGHPSRQFGLYHEDEKHRTLGVPENMATPIWDWGRFYELIIRSIVSGSWKNYEPAKAIRALNYWWGMNAGVIDVICSENMPVGTRRLIELLRKSIIDGSFHPFAGKLRDQEGNLRHDGPEPMLPEEIITMNWLVENVVGYIPKMEELTEEAKQVVATQGVNKPEASEIEEF